MSTPSNSPTPSTTPAAEPAAVGGSAVIAWLYVGVPLLWGVSQTFIKALALFK
ncbi:hypothetical protein ACFPAF_05620 [Hymenobacter endophyticus]|uniref:Oxalate:formate antiporter n=1 Tax=Hymenobacter endophyticus TaxID=3076335 RepID=A0ABU3TER0_9BACT|nr:hypothetical protein [Hymenobacter endophyticus]MDU0369866.1 hypothetical protein [Hymenobacter endophyticus]